MIWLLSLVSLVNVALSADLLEETRGVLGRDLTPPPGSELAVQLVDERRWDEAAVAWRQLAEAGVGGPDAIGTNLWAIISAVRASDQDATQVAMLSALEASQGEDPRVLLALAWVLTEAGAYKKAHQLLKDYPRSAPDAQGALVLQMRALMLRGKTRKALRVRKKALNERRLDAWFWFELGLEDAWREQPEAVEHMRRALRANYATGIHYQLLMQHLVEMGRYDEAVRAGLEGMARFPDASALGLSVLEICQDRRARTALEAIAKAEPGRPIPQAVLGTLLFVDEQPVEAAVHLQAAVDNGEDRPAMYRLLAEAHAASDQNQEAWTALSGGVDRHPEDLRLWRDLFAFSRDNERLSDALTLSEAAWEKGVRPVFLADISYQAANDMDALDLALRWSDRSTGLDGRRWQGLSQRALTLTRLGRGREALAAYEEALRLQPAEPQLLNNLAWFLLEPSEGVESDPDRALELAESAVAYAGEPVPAYLDTLARALWMLGQSERAIELQRQAASLDPDNEHIRNTLQRYETSESAP